LNCRRGAHVEPAARRLQDPPRRTLHPSQGAEHGLARTALPRDVRWRRRLQAEGGEQDVRGRFRLGLLHRMGQDGRGALPGEGAGPLRLVEHLVRELVRETAHPLPARQRRVHFDPAAVGRRGDPGSLPFVGHLDPESPGGALERAYVPRASPERRRQDRDLPPARLTHVEHGDRYVREATPRRREHRYRPFAGLHLAAERLPRLSTGDERRVRALNLDGELVERRVVPEHRHGAQRLMEAGIAACGVHTGREAGKMRPERIAQGLPVEVGRRFHITTVLEARTRTASRTAY
jgi:hypothetical protein